MAKSPSHNRSTTEINASSMADIAFLLLVFFLVTTQIVEDRGILVRLPPWVETPPKPEDIKKRNVFSVLVNHQNQLLVRGEPIDISDLRKQTKEFITNPDKKENLSEKPTRAVISLKNDRGTNYETYLRVYNELKAAYDELWDEVSRRKYGIPYSDDMSKAQKNAIKNEIPMVLSEAEPTSYGEEK